MNHKKDQSYGIIPLRFQGSYWEVFLVQHQAGHWSFPKGHQDPGETPLQTAERELKEETGLLILRVLTPEPLKEQYSFIHKGKKIDKTVDYFLALVEGDVTIQQIEIKDSQWLSIIDAQKRITFKEGQRLCLELEQILKKIIN